jgi:membrane protein
VVTVAGESDRATESEPAQTARRRWLGVSWTLISRTAAKSWSDRVFGLAAEAGFWQLISLPSALLAILGFIGYFSDALGPDTIQSLENAILRAARHVIVPGSVNSTIKPALHRILVGGRADVVSISFIVSLWTGSSAMATYVNTITIAYGFRTQRNAVRSRLLALVLYFGFIATSVVLLPLLVIGPAHFVQLFPDRWHDSVKTVSDLGYWPFVAVLSLTLLATLYHLAVPVRLKWRRALPGALVALVLWLGGSILLRAWLSWAFRSTATYGPLSAPVAVLVFLYLTALAILIGAEFNAQIDRLWPTRETKRARDMLSEDESESTD